MMTLMWGCEGGNFSGCFQKPNFVETCQNWLLSSPGGVIWVSATSNSKTCFPTFDKFWGHLTTSRGPDQPKPAPDQDHVLKTGEKFYFGVYSPYMIWYLYHNLDRCTAKLLTNNHFAVFYTICSTKMVYLSYKVGVSTLNASLLFLLFCTVLCTTFCI